MGKVTEKLSDTARSIKQVNITPDELKPTLLDETGKAVENTSKVLNFDLSVYVHDSVSDVNNLDLDWQIDDRLSNQIDSISIDEGKGKTPVKFKKDTNSNVWRADFNTATQMTWVSGGVLNGHVQKTGTITFKDSIFNVLKQADILNKNNEVDTSKDPLAYRSYVSYEGDTTESGHVWGLGPQFANDAYDPHSIIATTFNTSYFNTDKDNQIMAAEQNYGVSTADLNKDGTHSFVGGYDDVYYDSTNNTIVVDNYLNRWDSNANKTVKYWTYHYGVDPKLLPYIKSGEISQINFGSVIDSGASYKSQVRALPNATDDNDPTYKYHNQLLLDPNGDGAFSGQKGTNLGNYYYGILGSRPLVIRTIYHLNDKFSDGSKMSLTGLLREIGKTTTTPQLLFTNFMTDTEGKVVKGTESVSAPTFNQLFTPIAGPDQFTQTVNYVDGNGQTIASQNYVGKENTTQDFTGQVPQGWVLDDDTLPKTITIGTKNDSQNIKVKIDPQLVNDLQNNLRNANALKANTDTPKEADGALTKAIEDGNNTSFYGKDAPTNMQNAINELANTNDLVQALINGKNAESTAKYYNDTVDKQKALTDAMTAGTNAISSGITAQDQFEGAASAIETAINGLNGKETDKTALTDAISQGEAAKNSASYYNDGNADNKSALDNALSKAGEDLKNKALTQAAADADAQAIKDAINGLKGQPTSLDNLNQAISQGEAAKNSASYYNDGNADNKSALDNALSKAGEDLKNKALTQAAADADAQAIKDAINGLKGQPTSLDNLNQAISQGEAAKNSASYYNDGNADNKSALDNALSKAGEDLKNKALTQAAADADAQAIKDAINGLKGQPTSLDNLNQA
ncbi:FIVAR domain-containing protein, partial [Lactobacillus amylovorus]